MNIKLIKKELLQKIFLLITLLLLSLSAFAEQNSKAITKAEREKLEAIVEAAKSIKFTESQSEEKAMAEKLIADYEKMIKLEKKIAAQKQKIKRMQSTQTHSTNFTVTEDLYHKELKFIANQKDKYGFRIGEIKASKIIDNGGSEYQQYHKLFTRQFKSYH
ncbi:MAG: hypothetical protein AABY27_01405 [Pseudomonadota bacterium]